MSPKQNSLKREIFKGIWDENPVLVSLLGLCPTLAVTNSAQNGLAMSLATTFVLICSSIIIASLKNYIPSQVRIASYIVIIATFVTIADKFLAAWYPLISKSLGPYIPLIVVNCLILGRQEAFASKNSPFRALLDAIGMGIGFLIVLVLLGAVRELLGNGTIFGVSLLWDSFKPWMIMILPPGAFLSLGLIIAGANAINERRKT